MADAEPEESDPSGRYIRTNKLLGSGAYKQVYRGFDTADALEVAWNKLHSGRLSDAEVEKVSREVELLERVNHKNIINFFAGWHSVGVNGRKQMDFITELMTSGTLKEFIRKARSIKLKVIRRWSLNLLEAIAYLHNFKPPIMHRDLKCDNIFINGNVGEVKIGDLGLSSVKENEKALSVIGTPEFMAPELYEEAYTEKVDIYAFGMCMLEMLTMEYPYGECQNSAQIFRKVSRGEKPASLLKFVNSEFKEVIIRCLHREEMRPSALELLQHPLFNLWAEDDGRLSNVDLVRAENTVLRSPSPKMDNVVMGDMYVHHSPNLLRDVVITQRSKESTPNRPLPTEKGAIRIGLNVPVNGTVKKIEFMFDPAVDSPEEIANEMLLEFKLDRDQVERIRADINAQVQTVTSSGEKIVPSEPSDHFLVAANANAQLPNDNPVIVVPENGTDKSLTSGSHLSVGGNHERVGNSNRQRLSGSSSQETVSTQGRSGSAHTGSRLNLKSPQEHDSRVFASCMQLMDCCARGKLAQAKQKLEQGASPLFSDYDKRTPLHLAASEGHAEVVELLLQNSANPDATDRWGSTAMNDAIKNGHESVLNVLERYGVPREDVHLLGSQETASMELLQFCARGFYDLVRQRLMAGASAQFADYDQRTPLHLAASEGHAGVAELLLVNGARMDVEDRVGRTPIDDALKNGHMEVLRVMKQYGGEIPRKVLDGGHRMARLRGMDLIDHAANGRLEAVKECLTDDIDPDFADYDRRTALHLAVSESAVPVVRHLLLAGASVNNKDRWGSTPLDEAMKINDKDIISLLEAAGGLPGASVARPTSPGGSSQSRGTSGDVPRQQAPPCVHTIVNIEALKAMSHASKGDLDLAH